MVLFNFLSFSHSLLQSLLFSIATMKTLYEPSSLHLSYWKCEIELPWDHGEATWPSFDAAAAAGFAWLDYGFIPFYLFTEYWRRRRRHGGTLEECASQTVANTNEVRPTNGHRQGKQAYFPPSSLYTSHDNMRTICSLCISEVEVIVVVVKVRSIKKCIQLHQQRSLNTDPKERPPPVERWRVISASFSARYGT